jgi:hypothetical protein
MEHLLRLKRGIPYELAAIQQFAEDDQVLEKGFVKVLFPIVREKQNGQSEGQIASRKRCHSEMETSQCCWRASRDDDTNTEATTKLLNPQYSDSRGVQ